MILYVSATIIVVLNGKRKVLFGPSAALFEMAMLIPPRATTKATYALDALPTVRTV